MKRVYLDYNSTTPLEPTVLDAICETLKNAWGNPSSSHLSGRNANAALKQARLEVAQMINSDEEDIIFASGGTEINNWVIHNALQYYEQHCSMQTNISKDLEKPHIVTTNIEHDSILNPLKKLGATGRAEITYVPVSHVTQSVDVENVLSSIRPTTCLVTIMYANNETGAIQPVEKIFKSILETNKARKNLCRILTHTDAAQAIGKISVDVKDLSADYLTIVGHKFYGPRIGALYCNKPGKDCPLFPLIYGGNQENGFRSGTENVGMIAGLGKAAVLVNENLHAYSSHFQKMCQYLKKQLKVEFGDGIIFNNERATKVLPNTISVAFVQSGLEGYRILQVTSLLEASVGAACHTDNSISRVLVASGIPNELAKNTLRLSVGRETTIEDIDAAILDLAIAVRTLKNELNQDIKNVVTPI